MIIEIAAIGNELLAGLTVNTNAAWLSKKLADRGYEVARHTTFPDDEIVLLDELKRASMRADCVICTGGLGPTLDDLSGPIGEKLFGLAEKWPNPVGTAAGLLFKAGANCVMMLPGVPSEMRAIFDGSVAPYLLENYPVKEKKAQKRLNFFLLPELAVDPTLRELKLAHPAVSFGIYPQLGTLNVVLTGPEEELDAPYKKLKEKFKLNVFESETGKIDDAVHHLLIAKGKTLALAESITGGAVASRLTQHPGASAYFMGGIVCYSNLSKIELLSVNPQLIESEGAVSEAVAREMAQGALKVFHTDYALAVTGIAGPTGGTPDKPVGTAWCALASKDQLTQAWKLQGRVASREAIIEYATLNLLSHLYLTVVKQQDRR